MYQRAKVICIVDAYSTGAELAPHFIAKGWQCVHVQSCDPIPDTFASTFRHEDFVENIILDGRTTLVDVVQGLSRFCPNVVIAGTETGVELADYLAGALKVDGNDAASSKLRRDKFEMQEALRRNGLNSIAQMKARSSREAIEWAKSRNSWPVVVKPVDSAGADGVRFCNSETDISEASDAIIGSISKLGILNTAALVQERLVGQQYFINAVSMNGLHVFTEIWEDHKTEVSGAALICDREELLPFHGTVQQSIITYMTEALDVLGIMNGPSHSELMMTDNGPVLIETAARMQGTILHEAVVGAIGDSHVTCTVERYVDPEHFLTRLERPYSLKCFLFCVTLASERSGRVVKNNCLSVLAMLPSFKAIFHTPKEGDEIERTIDLFSNPGIIYLSHHSRAQIESDYREIRELERHGQLFTLA